MKFTEEQIEQLEKIIGMNGNCITWVGADVYGDLEAMYTVLSLVTFPGMSTVTSREK